MKRDLLARVRSAGDADPQHPTRRNVLKTAAVAGVGLGGVGAYLRGGVGDSPPSASGEEIDGQADPGGDVARRSVDDTEPPVEETVIGANLNGRPRRLRDDLGRIAASDTTWVRAFLDVRRMLASDVHPEEDPDVLALRRAAREGGCKLIVSLKWDFKANWGDKDPIRVPSPESSDERALFDCAARSLDAIGAPLDVVILGNEPMWETLRADVEGEDPPIVRFTRDAKDYLVRHGDFGDPSYLVGAFNRSHDENVRERQFPDLFREMYRFVEADEDVDGVDLHLHYDSLVEAEGMIAAARTALPDATITATEFSPMWRYDRHIDVPIGAFADGERFASDYDVPPETTAVEYFERAKRDPIPPAELADFYDAMPWYNVDHVADMHALLADYDVSVGTFGFLQGRGMRNEDWTASWTPFHINFLFQPALLRAGDGAEDTANPVYIDDYRELARPAD